MRKILYGEKNNINLKLLINLSRATLTIHRNSTKILTKGGLTLSQFGVLEALYHKGSMTISQIIQSILSTGGNITVVVKNLEKLHLIERQPNPEDKRSYLVSITEEGEKIVENIFPNHLKCIEQNFEILSLEEKYTLISLLKKISKK